MMNVRTNTLLAWRGFQLVVLCVLGLLMCSCNLLPTQGASNSAPNPTRVPSTPVSIENTPAPTTTRRATARPRATATRQPRTTATALRPTMRPRATARTTPVSAQATAPPIAHQVPGFRTVAAASLPREAHQTLTLIDQGGPFPYRQDGVVFQNRERHLPRQPNGYYHEYTVTTPGEGDRGARRIITGADGERFYTDDHYTSFVQVLP